MSEAGFGNLVRLAGRDRRRFALACLHAALGTALAGWRRSCWRRGWQFCEISVPESKSPSTH